jgi:hypothetical protein
LPRRSTFRRFAPIDYNESTSKRIVGKGGATVASAHILRSIVIFLIVAAVIVVILLVASGLFALSIGKEHVCNGIVKMTDYGWKVPAQLLGYCA